MKISKATMAVLKNYTTINPSMVFNVGVDQNCVSSVKTIMTTVKLEENFPVKFGIYDMNQFLNVLSLFEDPDIEFLDRYMTITKDNQIVKYRYSEPSLITTLSNEAIEKLGNMIKSDCVFTLSKDILKKIQDIVSVLRSEYLMFEGNGRNIFVKTFNPKDEGDSGFSLELGETDKKFKMILKYEHLKILPGDYTVTVSKNRLLKFVNNQIELDYVIPCEKDSSFD